MNQLQVSISDISFFKKEFIYLFLERGEGREKEKREKHQLAASRMPSTGDLACNLGMCPDQESNQPPSGFQVGTQSTESYQPNM